MKYIVLILLCFATLGAKAGAVSVDQINLLGIKIAPVTAELKTRLNLTVDKGVWVSDIQKGSVGDEYGFKKDDVILKVGDKEVSTVADLRKVTQAAKSPAEVRVTLIRQGKILNKKMLLMPANATGVVIA